MDSYNNERYNLHERSIQRQKEKELEERLPTPEASTQTSSAEPKDPKDFGFKENAQEVVDAVVGGGVDIYNSVVSLPKLLDKRFYQPTDPSNPWKYDSPLLIKNAPITETRWGKFLRTGVEFVGGTIGAGKIMWGAKGLKGLATAAKATRLGRVGMSGASGAAYDLVSNQSQETNMARVLVDTFPNKAGILEPLATTETMSPAMKSFYNMGEGLGLGGMMDLTFEAVGLGVKSFGKSNQKAKKAITGNKDELIKALDESVEIDNVAKDAVVLKGARQIYEKSEYRKYTNKVKKAGLEEPLPKDKFLKRNKSWERLSPEVQAQKMSEFAEKNEIDFGPNYDFTRRARKQGEANIELQKEQLEYDVAAGKPRENPAYYKGGDITDNQALTASDNPVEGVRDMIEIRNNPTQKYGSPRGPLTEANIRRTEYTAPGMMLEEVNALGKNLEASPSFQRLSGFVTNKALDRDLRRSAVDLLTFMDDSGHSRLMDISEDDVLKYIGDPRAATEIADGQVLHYLSPVQLRSLDLIKGQLLFEARDLQKSGFSVANKIDISANGSLLDGIMARYSALGRLRKEASLASSAELRSYGGGAISKKEIIARASDEAAAEMAAVKEVLKNDPDNALLEGFLHFNAESNGSAQTFKDFNAFFKRKLRGYKQGDVYQRNAILNEMMTMGVNSMLSGPKTPVRALVGTGMGTVMRPVATMLGAIGKSDDTVMRGAFHNIGGMVEARNEAWRKAVADFQSYNMNEEGFRGYIKNKKDQEWEQMMSWAETYGTAGDKASAKFADGLRGINKIPVFNYGPRIMRSMDTFFTQIIGRGRQRQLAFENVYKKINDKGLVASDADLDDLVRAAEVDFEGKVFDGDGRLTDEMAKFAADEAKLTQELTGFAKSLDKMFDQAPFFRPFFLFARTGVNALTMTSKYTP
ncbi:MAG: hypothetical protein CBD95_000960, partial [Flavobacteriales bacterium TMED235]